MYKFESKYIIIMNSNIKHLNTLKTNIDYRYQNITLTIIEIHYNNKCLEYTVLNKQISFNSSSQ